MRDDASHVADRGPGALVADHHRLRHDGDLSCRQVAKVLQSFLDGEVDGITVDKVEAHLEMCRRCGMESEVHREIKASLTRTGQHVPETTLRRLRRFGEELTAANDEPDA
ncbi:MAG: zf-HC2 domain-containing protein [Acidimicrobiales bacterium]|nr:zf-HC2 domain-containing protein [Acidimicrobiales bacterium]